MTSLNPVFTVGFQLTEVLRLHMGHDAGAGAAARDRAAGPRSASPSPSGGSTRYPSQMSGGQQQRVMIAMAIACEPKLLIADEPTTALDVTIQKQILDLIAALQTTPPMSVLFITHDLAVVGEIADHVVVMRNGEIRERGRRGRCSSSRSDPYTQALLKCRPRLDRAAGPPAGHRRLHERPRPSAPTNYPSARAASPPAIRSCWRCASSRQELLRSRGAVRPARVQGRQERVVQTSQGQDAGARRRIGIGQDHGGARR